MSQIQLPNPVDELEKTDVSGGGKVTRIEKLIIVVLMAETVQGNIETSQHRVYELLIEMMDRQLPTEKPPSKAETVAGLERLVVKDIVRKRLSTGRLFSLRILTEIARGSWGSNRDQVEELVKSREL